MFAHISQVGVKLKYVEAVMLSNLAHTSKSQSLEPAPQQNKTVSWSLTSLITTNMAISETKGQGGELFPTQ